MFRVNGITVDKVICNGRSGLTEHIGNDRVKSDVANGERVLETVFLTGFTGNQLVSVARILAQYAHPLFRDKATGNKAEPKQVADPFGILLVIFISFDGGNPFGVGDSNVNGILQQVVDGNVVFAGALHADVKAVVINEPLLESQNGAVEGGKPLLSIGWNNAVRGDERGDEKRFVDIDAAADWVDDPQKNPSLY